MGSGKQTPLGDGETCPSQSQNHRHKVFASKEPTNTGKLSPKNFLPKWHKPKTKLKTSSSILSAKFHAWTCEFAGDMQVLFISTFFFPRRDTNPRLLRKRSIPPQLGRVCRCSSHTNPCDVSTQMMKVITVSPLAGLLRDLA